MYDMHCHLDFAANASEAAHAAASRGIRMFSCTMDPDSFHVASGRLSPAGNVRVGLGLHPWRLADGSVGEQDVERFCEAARVERFIGEVGLDFGARHAGSERMQLHALQRVARSCSGGGKVISLHAVKAAGACMDVMEAVSCVEGNCCIFHWFSGSSPELARAVRLGFHFSVSERMLSTKRGRAYAQAIPAGRLLLETDLPQEGGAAMDIDSYEAALRRAGELLARLRGDEVLAQVEHVSARIFGDGGSCR